MGMLGNLIGLLKKHPVAAALATGLAACAGVVGQLCQELTEHAAYEWTLTKIHSWFPEQEATMIASVVSCCSGNYNSSRCIYLHILDRRAFNSRIATTLLLCQQRPCVLADERTKKMVNVR